MDRVYYQAPSKMVYPCILVTKENYKTDYSDDVRYRSHTRFVVTLISTDVRTDETVEKILTIPYCSYNRQYKSSENLIHDVFNVYI